MTSQCTHTVFQSQQIFGMLQYNSAKSQSCTVDFISNFQNFSDVKIDQKQLQHVCKTWKGKVMTYWP